MEALNYITGGHNMQLPPDAQIVQGVSGNGVYLPAGAGTLQIDGGDRNELSVSLWRQWDGIVESAAGDYRGVFEIKNIKAYFDNTTDFLTIELPGASVIVTDIEDDQEQSHWVFVFARNEVFRIYKNAEKLFEITVGDSAADLSDPFEMGGGKTHATFDELRIFKTALVTQEVNGLYRLISKGVDVQGVELIAGEVAPKYLGQADTAAIQKTVVITKGETLGAVDANLGDWVLMGKNQGGWTRGVCYRWAAWGWVALTPESNYGREYQAALLHILEIPELVQQTGHYGALFAQTLVAQKALIDNLIVKQLKVDSDPSATDDFEVEINETVGILAKNGGAKIFEIKPSGQPYFAGDVATGTSQLLDGGVFVQGGQIAVENNGWKGVIRPCDNGVELCILGGDGGAMTKKQLWTKISGGILSLFVLGGVSCGNLHQINTGAVVNGWVNKSIGGSNAFIAVASSGDTWVAVGRLGLVAVSRDNGDSWAQKSTGTSSYMYCVATNNSGTWIAGTSSGVLRSVDDGETWQYIHLISIISKVEDIKYGDGRWVAVGQYGVIATSLDDGQTWQRKFKHPTYSFYDVGFNGSTWVATGQLGMVFISRDNAETWVEKHSPIFQYGGSFSIINSGNEWVAIADYSNVDSLKSIDDGDTWSQIQLSGRKDIVSNGSLYASPTYGGITISQDQGQSWSPKNIDLSKEFFSVEFNGTTWVAAGEDGAIFISRDTSLW